VFPTGPFHSRTERGDLTASAPNAPQSMAFSHRWWADYPIRLSETADAPS